MNTGIIRIATATLATLVLSAAAWAADANGKWTWTMRRGDNEIRQTLELKQDGEKLTGAVIGRNDRRTEIREGSVKGGELTFTVVREFQGREIKSVYKGKVEGDTIKGTISGAGRNGEQRSREWTANRMK
jgi:hypothetical protein